MERRKMGNLTIYPVETLEKAFDQIKNSEDWRAPINAIVTPENLAPVVEAIMFYTATQPKISVHDWFFNEEGKITISRYCVESEGYRNGPAGP